MNTSIIKVEKNSFTDKQTGEVVEYTKLSCLVPVENKTNSIGYDVESYTTKYDHYEQLVKIFKENKPVNINFDLVKVNDKGHYKKKPVQINDWKL